MRLSARPVVAGRESGFLLEAGQGDTVLILASPLVLALSYRPLMERLRRRFRVMALEMPGCGSGSRLSVPWSFEQYAGWVGALLDRLDLVNVTLVGHSNSGAIALIAAARGHPRIGRVVLADGVGTETSGPFLRILCGRFLDSFLEIELSVSGWHHLAYNAFAHTRSFFRSIGEADRSDLLESARQVRVPVLLAWGSQDWTMPLRCAHAYRRNLPNARLYVSRSGSHDWLITNPAEFADVVSVFSENPDLL